MKFEFNKHMHIFNFANYLSFIFKKKLKYMCQVHFLK